jgi:hypothetical protein
MVKFNSNSGPKFDHAEASKANVLPEGDYLIQVPPFTLVHKKDGSSSWLSGMALVLATPSNKYVGRRFQMSFTMEHDNEDAQRIGHRQFAQLAKACGFADGVEDSDQLTGHRVWCALRVTVGNDGVERNQIRSFKPENDAKKEKPAASPASAPAPSAGPDGIPF